ncbi:hypothetical protein QBC45DRAFT_114052 [Copromyces sp. CBS 386.78]|nr:hypothetical protein QBC45DRAFT_114052 [Copromyces sp. CBS 386.78]
MCLRVGMEGLACKGVKGKGQAGGDCGFISFHYGYLGCLTACIAQRVFGVCVRHPFRFMFLRSLVFLDTVRHGLSIYHILHICEQHMVERVSKAFLDLRRYEDLDRDRRIHPGGCLPEQDNRAPASWPSTMWKGGMYIRKVHPMVRRRLSTERGAEGRITKGKEGYLMHSGKEGAIQKNKPDSCSEVWLAPRIVYVWDAWLPGSRLFSRSSTHLKPAGSSDLSIGSFSLSRHFVRTMRMASPAGN